MAIDKNSKAYQALLKSGYTDSQIEQMHGAVSSGQSAKDVIANTKVGSTSTTSTTSTPSTSKSSNQQTITYNGQVSDRGNTSGTANMNSMSQSKAIDNSRNFQVGTGDVAEMPQQPKVQSVATSQDDRLAKAWQGLDYETQQKKLSSIAGLKDALAKKGITSKTAPTTTQTTTTPKKTTTQTPKQDQWDYQDNSQARMNQIADNLDGYRQTMPQLFDDMSAFYNFFIKDKGRSQDQIDFLWDYFNRVQKYGKYDNMSPDELGKGIANGNIPEDYLNTLKATDPAKYQEVMAYKKDTEDTIKNEGYLNDAAVMAGMEGWESEPSSIKYAKWNEIWMDEDSNGIDDRREHYASEEEQGYQKQIADLNAANLDIDNKVKHDYDDLVERYPGATKATLMAMAQDQNAKLLREKENNLVELTRLQGYVSYMQEERFEMNKAGADSIAQLQKNLGLYYEYSPEGMAELAQAKYGATNITLDQADSGNETQKQMALQNVLDGYYDKYGDIIQRSEQQVINDVIAYAKKNGIGLAQALQENFVKPLQSKPEFATLSSGRSITDGGTDKWSVETIKDANGNDLSVMINQATGETRLMNGNAYTGGTSGTTSTGKSYNVVSPTELTDGLSNFVSGYELGDFGGRCGAFVNEGLKQMGVTDTNMYGDSKESKLGTKNEDANATAQTGWVAIWKPEVLTGDGAKYGHVGFVVQDNGDGTVKVLDSNGTKNPATGKYDKTVGVHDVPKSSLYGYFNPSQGTGTAGGADDGQGDLYYARVLGWIPTQLRNTDVEKQWYIDIAKEQREKGLNAFEAAMSIVGFNITNKSEIAQNLKNMVLDTIKKQGSDTLFDSPTLSSMAEFINSGNYEGALETLENQLGNYMESKGKYSRDDMTSASKAIKDLEKIKTWKSYGAGGWNTISDLIGAEGKNTATFNVWTSNVSRVLRGLGYEKEEIDEMIPKLTNDKTTFNNRLSAMEDALLGQYNSVRRNRGMPAMTLDALLGNQSLTSIYRIWNTDSFKNLVNNAQNRDFSGRYGQPTTITAEAIKII